MKMAILCAAILAAGLAAPFVVPDYTTQASVLWVMVLLALTWDMQGGQMGYNSLGNIFFFGLGMYASAVVQIGLFHPVGDYTYAAGVELFEFTPSQYWTGLALGIPVAGVVCAIAAIPLGLIFFGLRGPYFAIGTLAVAVAAGELFSAWEWVGAGSGVTMPSFPHHPDLAKLSFYYMNFAIAVVLFALLAWIYATRFGLAINAIRDDEQKAESMGLHTTRYKCVNWSIAAFFLGMSGAIFGNMVGFIDPREVAFATITFGIFMVVMALLGGKGTLWGPVVGAVMFHSFKEVTWTYMLGWQWVALGGLIVLIVVYFQDGFMGWLMRVKPEWFGIRVEARARETGRARAMEAAQ
ncbi:MAG TPA: branched-chain amino acid ABC transporter permease [Thermohalobaculum sp.]|nr:branched-chain amino acid ABC transporter permease [Thermohalobaculum sp.]